MYPNPVTTAPQADEPRSAWGRELAALLQRLPASPVHDEPMREAGAHRGGHGHIHGYAGSLEAHATILCEKIAAVRDDPASFRDVAEYAHAVLTFMLAKDSADLS